MCNRFLRFQPQTSSGLVISQNLPHSRIQEVSHSRSFLSAYSSWKPGPGIHNIKEQVFNQFYFAWSSTKCIEEDAVWSYIEKLKPSWLIISKSRLFLWLFNFCNWQLVKGNIKMFVSIRTNLYIGYKRENNEWYRFCCLKRKETRKLQKKVHY